MEIDVCIKEHYDCNLVLGGDFNCHLDSNNPATNMIFDFIKENNFHRSDLGSGSSKAFTYGSDVLGNHSCVDFVLMSAISKLCSC